MNKRLEAGLNAIERGNFLEAITLLQEYCQEYELNSQGSFREYIQAQASLIKAYAYANNKPQAIAHCNKLATSEHPQVREWAKKVLTSLSPQAVIPKSNEASTVNITQQSLYTSEEVVGWLKAIDKDLFNNKPLPLIPLVSECKQPALSQEITQQADLAPSKYTNINFTSKNLSSFQIFCKQELLLDLRIFEKGRRQALVTLIVSSIILIVSIYLPTPLFIKLISTSHTTTDEVFEFIDFGLFSITLPISWYADLIIRLSILFIYVILILVLFSGWSLLYNSLFETFSYGFDNKIGGKIHQFISFQENSNKSNLFLEEDINKTLQNLQHSQILDGIFKPNNIKQDSYIHGYANDIGISITQIEAQSGFDHYWTRMLDIDFSATAPENFVSLNGLMLVGNIVLLCIPTLVMLIIRLTKGVPYVLTQVFKGKNIDYKRFKIEIINNQAYHKNIFKGLFFGAKFNKHTKVITIIQPKGLKTDINSISHGNKELIKLEDPEFLKYFTVYSEDQVEARYILSTNLMKKLVDFKKKVGKNVYVSFVENMIYIAVEYPNGLFEPSLYKSMLSFAPLREYFKAIQLMLGLVEELNLDRKIWSTNE